jgi:uncharacterized protein
MELVPSRANERVFLSAEWRDLLMLNYEADPSLLRIYIPHGTKLDSFGGKTYVSLVGFRFLETKLFGFLPIPFHTNFDEVNLRFYVRRGVVFIREIVPRRAIASIARIVYGENYVALTMRHRVQRTPPSLSAEYQFRIASAWCTLRAATSGDPVPPQRDSLEQFITEHYWGYSARHEKESLEYRVSHVPWRVWSCTSAAFEGDASASLAVGSPVFVHSATLVH